MENLVCLLRSSPISPLAMSVAAIKSQKSQTVKRKEINQLKWGDKFMNTILIVACHKLREQSSNNIKKSTLDL